MQQLDKIIDNFNNDFILNPNLEKTSVFGRTIIKAISHLNSDEQLTAWHKVYKNIYHHGDKVLMMTANTSSMENITTEEKKCSLMGMAVFFAISEKKNELIETTQVYSPKKEEVLKTVLNVRSKVPTFIQIKKIISNFHNEYSEQSTLDKVTIFANNIFKEINVWHPEKQLEAWETVHKETSKYGQDVANHISRSVISKFDNEESQRNLISGLSGFSLHLKGKTVSEISKLKV